MKLCNEATNREVTIKRDHPVFEGTAYATDKEMEFDLHIPTPAEGLKMEAAGETDRKGNLTARGMQTVLQVKFNAIVKDWRGITGVMDEPMPCTDANKALLLQYNDILAGKIFEAVAIENRRLQEAGAGSLGN